MHESEEDRIRRINSSPIPEALWKLIPKHGEYLINIMKRCLYGTRNSIMTLQSEVEVKKMLQYVIDQEELFEDEERRAMFGQFVNKPHLLSIPPGLHADFKLFLKAVDDLIKPPKKTISSRLASNTRKRPSTSQDDVPSSSKEREKPTAEEVTNTMRKHFRNEALSAFQNGDTEIQLTEEMIDSAFTITSSGHNYKFKCMKVGCKEVSAIPYDSLSNKVLLSNRYRHLRLCLLGIGRKGKETGAKNVIKPEIKPPKFMKKPLDFFAKKNKPSIPRPPSDNVTIVDEEIEFAMTTTRSVADSLTIDSISATSSTTSTTIASVSDTPVPKNLQAPAGLRDPEDGSGL